MRLPSVLAEQLTGQQRASSASLWRWWCWRKAPFRIAYAFSISYALIASSGDRTLAQIIPDTTLGSENSLVTPITPTVDQINGGATRGANLFHSFQEFNVGNGRSVYFTNPVGIENILSRVTGSNPSNIFGKLGVNGNANLFLINPNGIIFGSNAQLDIGGSFFASTASSFKFTDGSEFSATNPQAPPLLTINVTLGLQWGASTPGATISNRGNLASGQDLTLVADQLDLQGQLQAGRDLTLLAQDTVRVRDTVTTPFLAQAGGNLTVQGNQGIDILALNHPTQTPFVSGGNLSLISDGIISGDAHFAAGGNVSILNLSGGTGTFVSFYDPIISSNGNVSFGNYTGASLKVEATGSITGGNIRITSPDTALSGSDPDIPILTSSPALILRAGLTQLANSANVPQSAGGTTFTSPGGAALPGSINVGSINTSSGSGSGGSVILSAVGNITTGAGGINSSSSAIGGNGGNISLTSITGAINTSAGTLKSTSSRGNGGAIALSANGNITAGELYSIATATGSTGGNITISSTQGTINTGFLDSGDGGSDGNAGAINLSAFGDITIQAGGSPLFTIAALSRSGSGADIRITSSNGSIDTSAGFIQTTPFGIVGNAGSITMTAAGSITTGGLLSFVQNSSNASNGGAISLTANGNITTGYLISGTNGSGNGSDIRLTSLSGAINTSAGFGGAGFVGAGSNLGNGATIAFSAKGDITTAILDSRSFGSGNGGNITLNSTAGAINTTAGDVVSVSNTGNGGAIALSAVGDITTATLNSRSVSGNGGNITLTSNARISAANSLIGSYTFTSGKAGDITITARSVSLTNGTRVFTGTGTDTGGTGQGGNLTINASESVELSGISPTGEPTRLNAETAAAGNAGNLTINTRQFIARDGATLSTDTKGTGQGGNLIAHASDFVELSGTSSLTADTYAAGNAGNLTVKTGRLIVRNGAAISSSVAPGSTGRGGNLTVNASNSLELDGTSPNGKFPSRLATATAGNENAGNLDINTGQLIVRNGAVISTATVSSGKGGNLTVNSDSVELIGTSADGQLLSALSTDTGGTGQAGDLTINTRQLTIRDGGAVSSSSFSQGQGGKLIVNASEFVELRGTAANGFASGLYAQGFSSGTGGNLKVTTGDLRIFDRARITVAAGAAAETRVPTSRLPGVGVTVGDRATGNAGNLEVEANSIYLNNQGAIFASTTSGEGGNIKLTARDLLLMRHKSLISAEAGGTGNGGNVAIDAQFIVGVPKEDSDIIANAFKGNGGRVQITTQGIYGLQYRPQRTPLSDITASSQFGVNGTVQINSPDVDPSRGLANLPENLVDTSALIANSCIARSSQQGGSFTITGRGGLPTRPGDAFTSPYPTGTVRSIPSTSASNHAPSSDLEATNPKRSQPRRVTEPIDRIRQSTQAQNHPDAASSHTPTLPTPAPLVEASGWVYGANGEVILTAQSPTVTPHSSWSTLPTCPE